MKDTSVITSSVEVDISSIEKELEALWKDTAKHESGEAVTRATAFNLVYVVPEEVREKAADILRYLTLSHPARSILISLGDEDGAPMQRAVVSSFCHKPSPTSPQQIYSEFITLELAGNKIDTAHSSVLMLLLSGLPTVLVWDESLPLLHELLNRLAVTADRVICSVAPTGEKAPKLTSYFSFRNRAGKDTVVRDLVWSRIKPWQLAIAQLYDVQSEDTARLESVNILFKTDDIPAGALVLAAWVSYCLGWEFQKSSLQGKKPILSFKNGKKIMFDGGAESENHHGIVGVELFVKDQAEPKYGVYRDPQRLESFYLKRDNHQAHMRERGNSVEDQLRRELMIWGNDPLYDETMSRVQLWLKELLFS